jgi:hypothetical protein
VTLGLTVAAFGGVSAFFWALDAALYVLGLPLRFARLCASSVWGALVGCKPKGE